MALQPDQFGRRETGHRFDAHDEREIGVAAPEFARLGEGARVIVQNGRPQRAVGLIEQNRAMHLPGKTDRRDGLHRRRRFAHQGGESVEHGVAPIVGVLFRPKAAADGSRQIGFASKAATIRSGDR